MQKKFLVIGNSAISQSLVQVIDLFVPYSFENIEVSDLSSLDGLHDRSDVFGLIVTPPDEIELAKHIRLTDTLGNLRLLPIIVLSPYSLENHLREKRDNLFLLSPEVYLLTVSGCIPELLNVIEKARHFESQEKMRVDLRPFIVWTEEDDIVSSHDNFNRCGPFRLMQEQFGELPEFISSQYENISSRLWFKKQQFLESHNIRAEVPPVDEEPFRRTVSNKRVLYIDDEHRLGWSFALYSLFAGNSDHSHYQLFQDSAPFISTSDGRFACIDNVEETLKVIEVYHESLKGALSEYSEAEYQRNRLAEEIAEVRKSAKEIEEKTRNAEANVSRIRASLRETEDRVKDIQERLKEAMDTFADVYLKGTGEVAVSEVEPEVKGISEGYSQYDKEINALIKYRDEYKRSTDIYDRHKAELERLKPLLAEAEAKNTVSIKRYDEALKALSRGRLFPYDLVILDLRLERLLDKDRLPDEISGVRVLKRIKKVDPSVPVLMFTASEKAMNYQQAMGLGASGYWIKAVNSLSALKSEIVKSLARAHEARNLWLRIRRIEAKRQLSYTRENPSTRQLEKGIMNDSKKSEITMLLKESFLLFMKEPTPYEQSVQNYTHYGKIVLNMGMIQEERFSRIQDKRWDFWVNQKAREIDQDEIMIRQLRNRAAHRAGSGITYQEALDVFQKTLERILKS